MNLLAGHLDFGLPGAVLAAMIAAVLQPLYLFVLARIPGLSDRNARQFFLSAVGSALTWTVLVCLVPPLRPAGIAEAAVAIMAIGAVALVYLEIWGLMSRGYTLGVLLTIHKAGRPLTVAEIRRGYRGGDGLDWIMRHRLGDMLSTGVIERRHGALALTPGRGLLVARLYLASVTALGLRRTG